MANPPFFVTPSKADIGAFAAKAHFARKAAERAAFDVLQRRKAALSPGATDTAQITNVCYSSSMNQFSAINFPIAEPLGPNSSEMATARIKVIIARRGFLLLDGRKRTAFVVGSCAAPIEVAYSDDASCTEFVLPPWVGTAVLGVSGRDLCHSVNDVSELPATPFLNAIQRAAPDALDIARLSYMNWSAGGGTSDARIAQRVWHAMEIEPIRQLNDIALSLGVSDRRIRAAVKQESGLTPAQWRKLVRLEKASHAITHSVKTMATVAVDAGYADQSHMNRDFMALAGTSPAKLRRAK